MTSPIGTSDIKRFYDGMQENSLHAHYPTVKKILTHFISRGCFIRGGGKEATPSLSIRTTGIHSTTLFRLGCIAGGIIDIPHKDLSQQIPFKERPEDLEKMQSDIRKIYPQYRARNTAQAEPNFSLGLMSTANVDSFIEIFNRVHDCLQQPTQLSQETTLKSERAIQPEERLARAWDILTRCALESELKDAQITYEDFRNDVLQRNQNNRVKGTGTAVYLDPIQNLCVDNGLPPITGLVVSKKSSKPKSGYIGIEGLSYKEQMQRVLAYDWSKESNPWRHNGQFIDIEGTKNKLLNLPNRTQAFTTVPVRQHQPIFRKALFKVYGGRCAICNIDIPEILDAAHIKPWSVCDVSEKADVTNGILLCKNHHATFDKKLWWLTDSRVIEKARGFAATEFGKRTCEFSLPSDERHAPRPVYLAYHRNNS